MFGRFGIASRLFAAFAGVAALSIAAGVIGWVVLRNVDTAQTTIVDQAMPAIAEGRIIAETSAQIAAHGALLATAESQAGRQAQANILRSTTDLLSARLDALEGYGFPEREVAELRGVVSALAANLDRQDEIVAARIETNAVLLASVARTLEAARELSGLSETLTSNAASGATVVISNLYELAEDQARLAAMLDAFDRLVEADLFLLERMFELRMRASEQGLLLNQLGRARDAGEIGWIEGRYSGNLRILVRRVALIDDPIRREQGETLVAALSSDGPPGTLGLFDQRRRSLALDAAAAALAGRQPRVDRQDEPGCRCGRLPLAADRRRRIRGGRQCRRVWWPHRPAPDRALHRHRGRHRLALRTSQHRPPAHVATSGHAEPCGRAPGRGRADGRAGRALRHGRYGPRVPRPGHRQAGARSGA